MRTKEIICQYCHQKAVVPITRMNGYCDNCRKLAHNNSARQYYYNTKAPVVVERKVSTVAVDNLKGSDIEQRVQQLCEKYDGLRKETLELRNEINERKKKLTKSGDVLLHKLEFEDMSDAEFSRDAIRVKQDRILRRGYKIEECKVNEIMGSLGIRSAKGLNKAITQGARTTRDLEGYVESLRQNAEIYVWATKPLYQANSKKKKYVPQAKI